MMLEASLGINQLPPSSSSKEKTLLTLILLCYLRKAFHEYFQNRLINDFHHSSMECAMKDIKTTQLLIRDIVESNEYTLEGIAYQTHLPFDVILDAACGHHRNVSITAWAKIVELYAQVKPEVVQALLNKLPRE